MYVGVVVRSTPYSLWASREAALYAADDPAANGDGAAMAGATQNHRVYKLTLCWYYKYALNAAQL